MGGVNGLAGTVVMVRADSFGANPETLASNEFQIAMTEADARERALAEQASLAEALRSAGVEVLLLTAGSDSPDAVFPNNWFSTHEDGRVVLYPMQAPSRRRERIEDLCQRLDAAGFVVSDCVDLSAPEAEGRFLEGTGSLVLDRISRIAYACSSARTHVELAQHWAQQLGYELCWFNATGPNGLPLYHTNVIMSLGAGIAIVCMEAVRNEEERARLRQTLTRSGQTILEIDWQQVRAFAGNQLFLRGETGPVVALSATADRALRPEQKALLDQHAERVVADIATIERHGGGSVRCMLAEVFLPKRNEQGAKHD